MPEASEHMIPQRIPLSPSQLIPVNRTESDEEANPAHKLIAPHGPKDYPADASLVCHPRSLGKYAFLAIGAFVLTTIRNVSKLPLIYPGKNSISSLL